jgi:hypothetical protein
MPDSIASRRYAQPAFRKLERLADIAAKPSTSGAAVPKGGCFQSKSGYEPPVVVKKEKLSDVAGLPPVSTAD